MVWKRILTTGALTSAVLFSALAIPSGTAFAREKNCREKVQHERQKLDQAVRKHGERSHQAENERNKLRELREKCGGNNYGHRRDRDHDHDHDHDHDFGHYHNQFLGR